MEQRTRTKDVKGLIYTPRLMQPYPTPITVRVTSDEHGESISFADELGGVMLMVPVEAVKDLIKVVK